MHTTPPPTYMPPFPLPQPSPLGRGRTIGSACSTGWTLRPVIIALTAILTLVTIASAAEHAPEEDKYYQIITLPTPAGVVMESGALEWLPEGKLAVSTRLGDIFTVETPLANPPSGVKYTRFASGLHEVLGL